MSNEQIIRTQRVTLTFPTLITDCIGSHVAKEYEASVEEVTALINKGIEAGVATSKTHADLESLVRQGRGILRAGDAIRKEFTKPLDQAKSKCIEQQRQYLGQLQLATDKADRLCVEEADRKESEKQRLIEEAEAENRRRETAAAAEEQRRINISRAKGGTGENVKPVVAEPVVAPVAHITMRNTTRVKYRVDDQKIRDAIDRGVRDIPGVRIYPVWNFVIEDRKAVPKEYKSAGR